MSKTFLLIGAIIFAIYIYLMFTNIYIAHKKQKEDHYPNLSKDDIFKAYKNQEKKAPDDPDK